MRQLVDDGFQVSNDPDREAIQQLDQTFSTTSSVHPSAELIIKTPGASDKEFALPVTLVNALRQVVHYMAQEDGALVLSMQDELTTQEAADILNVSRPYLVKLLESGAIAYHKVGSHRRVRLRDLLMYKHQRDAERRAGLALLTQMSQELGLDDE